MIYHIYFSEIIKYYNLNPNDFSNAFISYKLMIKWAKKYLYDTEKILINELTPISFN